MLSLLRRSFTTSIRTPSSSNMGKVFSQAGPISTTDRLSKLRSLLKQQQLHALIVPTDDAHASEYVAPCDARREYISGFSGSAGVALIELEKATMFTDGRYTLQASSQLDDNWQLYIRGVTGQPLWNEYVKTLPKDWRIGVDASTISISDAKELTDEGVHLVETSENLVDQVWGHARPARPAAQVDVHDVKYAGQESSDKVEKLRQVLAEKQAQALVVAALDEVAWLLNLRGADIDYNPVFFSYVLLTTDALHLFVNEAQLSSSSKTYLQSSLKAQIHPYSDFLSVLQQSAASVDKILVPDSASWAISKAATSEKSLVEASPLALMKAVKNETELQGFRDCHIRDGAALTAYFAWLEEQLHSGAKLTEYEAALKLEEYRSKQDLYKGLSFTTISSTGPNAAIIHYSPSETESAVIDKEQVYLCDSGAQFQDGTTDVTRTLHFGSPSAEIKEANTLVLKGHIAIDTARFPKGTTGFQLDTLARAPLWQVGLDYAHGTGHGIGSFLNVHEGPHSISFRESANKVAFEAGMMVSNEPGYYKDGAWGIRIESVVLCKELKLANNFRDKGYLGFERVTMAPITPNLIEPSMLLPGEKQWLNDYHAEVQSKLEPLLQGDARALAYLKRECAPLE